MNLLNIVLASMNPVNLSEFYEQTIDWAMTPFSIHLGGYVWPMIFATAIGCVYVATHNIGSVLAIIMLVFGLFGSSTELITVPEMKLFFNIVAGLSIAGLILSLIIKKHG